MPRPAGYAKFPLIVAAPVNLAQFERLEEWAQHRDVSKAQLLRDLIAQHIPDLRKLSSGTRRRITAEEVRDGSYATDVPAHHI